MSPALVSSSPTEAPQSPQHAAPLWLRFLQRAEDWIGGFWTTLLDLTFTSALILATLDPAVRARPRTGLAMLLAFVATMTARHIRWLWSEARRSAHPLALAVAMRQAPPWLILRPLVSLWWLFCFGAGCAFAVLIQFGESHGEGALIALLVFAYVYAANAYLLLAISAWTNRAAVLQTVWRFRILIDLLVATCTMWGPRLYHSLK
jgi:hypothetical protein